MVKNNNQKTWINDSAKKKNIKIKYKNAQKHTKNAQKCLLLGKSNSKPFSHIWKLLISQWMETTIGIIVKQKNSCKKYIFIYIVGYIVYIVGVYKLVQLLKKMVQGSEN